MANIEIPLSSAQSLGVDVDKVEVKRINLRSDGSGTWTIGVDLPTTTPARTEVESVNISERHMVSGNAIVTRQEIADAQGISVDDVRATLTLEQTEAVVTQIALGKILTALGLTA